jgi:hypothetical protein
VQFAATGMIRHNVYFRRSSATYEAFLREEVISIFQELAAASSGHVGTAGLRVTLSSSANWLPRRV